MSSMQSSYGTSRWPIVVDYSLQGNVQDPLGQFQHQGVQYLLLVGTTCPVSNSGYSTPTSRSTEGSCRLSANSARSKANNSQTLPLLCSFRPLVLFSREFDWWSDGWPTAHFARCSDWCTPVLYCKVLNDYLRRVAFRAVLLAFKAK